jgi:hypothetical protein
MCASLLLLDHDINQAPQGDGEAQGTRADTAQGYFMSEKSRFADMSASYVGTSWIR